MLKKLELWLPLRLNERDTKQRLGGRRVQMVSVLVGVAYTDAYAFTKVIELYT